MSLCRLIGSRNNQKTDYSKANMWSLIKVGLIFWHINTVTVVVSMRHQKLHWKTKTLQMNETPLKHNFLCFFLVIWSSVIYFHIITQYLQCSDFRAYQSLRAIMISLATCCSTTFFGLQTLSTYSQEKKIKTSNSHTFEW